MAQVRKYSTGGPAEVTETKTSTDGTPEKAKVYGKLIRNGVVYDMDEEKMKSLEQYIMSLNPELQPYIAEDFRRLQNGENVTIDTMRNRRDGNDDYMVLNDRQEDRLRKNKVKEGFFSALFNTKTHKFNQATYEFGKWDPESKVRGTGEEIAEKIKLYPKTGLSFEFDNDEIDKYVYNTLDNEEEMKEFELIYDYLTKPDIRNKYDISAFPDLQVMADWYDRFEKDNDGISKGQKVLDTLRKHILGGLELTNEENQILKRIPIKYNRIPSATVRDEQQEKDVRTQLNTDWTGYDPNKVWGDWNEETHNMFFIPDGKGGFTINTNAFFPEFKTNQNYYFNEEFFNRYGRRPEHKPLVGKIYFEGKWYSDKDLLNQNSTLYQILNSPMYDYFGKNRRGDYKAANDVLMTSWDKRETLLKANSEENADYLGNFYRKNFLYENLDWNKEGATYRDVPIDPTYEVIRGLNLDEDLFLQDGTFRRPYKYWVRDANGNLVSQIGQYMLNPQGLSIDDFSGLYDWNTDQNKQRLNEPVRVISRTPGDLYEGMYLDNIGNFGVYRNPQNPNFVHVSIPQEFGGVDGRVYKNMPIWLYEKLSQLYTNRLSDKYLTLSKKLFDLINRGTLRLSDPELITLFGEDKYKDAVRYFKNESNWDKAPSSFKKGGVLKGQQGLVTNLEYQSKVPEETSINRAKALSQAYRNPYEYQNLRGDELESFWSKVGKEDAAELTGLVLDLAGFATGFVPGYGDAANIALSSIGANIAYGIADRRKVKAGVLSPGAAVGNILTNVGMDVASLIPGAGDLINGNHLIKKFVRFLKGSNKYIEYFKTGMSVYGLVNGIAALDKALDESQELTLQEIKDLTYGIMAVTGLTRRGVKAYNEARLAHHSHPGAEVIPHKTKYKTTENGAEVEKYVEFSPTDIEKATKLRLRGKNSKSELAKIIKEKYPDIPDSEVSRIIGDPKSLRELGLVFNDRAVGPNDFSEATPEAVPKVGNYFFNVNKRNTDLKSRTSQQIAQTIDSQEGLGKVAAEIIVPRGKNDIPTGYKIENEGVWYRRPVLVKATPETAAPTQRSDGQNSNEAPAQRAAESNSGQPSPETTRTALTPEQARNLFKTSGDKIDFLQKLNESLGLPEFRDFATSNPTGARSAIDKEIEAFVRRTVQNKKKRDAARNTLADEANAMIRGMNYTFKDGGKIVKAKMGIGNLVRNIGNWIVDPETLHGFDSAARYVNDAIYNINSATLQKNAVKDAVTISQPKTPTEIYSPQIINAGNAERQFAQSQFQYRPSPTSDPDRYEAWKKEGYDKGNLSLANATRLDSQQDIENGLRWVNERRNYAFLDNEAMNQHNKNVAGGITAEAQIEDIKRNALSKSFDQLIYQRQRQRDENRNGALAYAKEKMAWETQQAMQKKLDEEMSKAFPPNKPYNPTNPEHRRTRALILQEVQTLYAQSSFTDRYNLLTHGEQRYFDNYIDSKTSGNIVSKKSGGRLRPASEQIAINREKSKDQIKVNREKSIDKIWESELKDARRALEKMSDRTHKILMKILS